DVHVPVAVEVRHGQRVGKGDAAVIDGALKGAVAVAQEHAQRGPVEVPYRKVQIAVVVEVGGGDHFGPVNAGKAVKGGRLEGPIPVTQQHADADVPKDVGHGHVEVAVPVKVPNRHACGSIPGREFAGAGKRAVAIAQEDTNRAVAVGDDQVRDLIPVEV